MSAARRSAAPRRLEEAWAARVRANREQAERLREVPVGDFYAPVSAVFVADPRRTGEPALDVLQAMRPGWTSGPARAATRYRSR